jgi:predicted permease
MRRLLRAWIGALARLVPAAARREFRAEWDAELAVEPTMRRASGAAADAWFLRRQAFSLDSWLHDVRYAVRVLARRPAYTSLVVVTLAIGIGATTAVFSAIDSVLLRPLPYPDSARLVTVWENDRLNRQPRSRVAPGNWHDWRSQTRSFEDLAAYIDAIEGVGGGSLSAGGDPFHATVPAVSTNFFGVMGVRPLLGRAFTPGDVTPPNHRVLVLSFRGWQNHFGSDPGVIDRTVRFDDVPHRIVGVMPAGFQFPLRDGDAWRLFPGDPQASQERGQHLFTVVGRLRPGVSLDTARQDLEQVAIRAQQLYPVTNAQRGTTLASLQDAMAGDLRSPMLLLGAAVAVLLVISAVNVANLMLVEATARRREIALRAAVGAGRFRIFRQLVFEGLMLALGGGALGVALAAAAVKTVARAAVDYVPRADQIGIDGRVLTFAVLLSGLTGLVFALSPALLASRADVQQDLREGALRAVGGSRRLRSAFVVVQFAAAVVLVFGAGLLLRSFWNILRVQPGYESDHVMVATVELPRKYNNAAAITQFYGDLLARLGGRGSIRAAGIVNNLPVSGSSWTTWLTIENVARPDGEPPEVGHRRASPGYFGALRIPVLDGRGLADSDTPESLKVAVVNHALASRFFPRGGAVGARIRIGRDPKAPWRTIVGVVGDVRHTGPEKEPGPEVFLPVTQSIDRNDMSLAVRAEGDPAALAGAIRDTARSIDPSVMLWRIGAMDELMDDYLAPRRLSLRLVQGFAALALALALIGIYGVLSYTVSQRVPEIGVRMALGARRGEIVRLMIASGARLGLIGIAAGVAVSLATSRILNGLLFGVERTDAVTYVSVIVLMLVAALLACAIPAMRAARVNPLSAIRAE